MEIKGVSLDDFERIVDRVSRDLYGGNLKVNDDAHSLPGRLNTRARLVAKKSKRWGARRSSSGRHGPYASWEAYRDVLTALFNEYPDARVRTSLANYVGRAGFQELYPATAYHNVGNMFNPMTMPDLTVYPAAVDIQPITADESARWAALAATRLAENQQYWERYPERDAQPAEDDADRGVRQVRDAVAGIQERERGTHRSAQEILAEARAARPANREAAQRAERQEQYRALVAENAAEAERWRAERAARRDARDAREDREEALDARADRAETARHYDAEAAIKEIDDLLAEVAEEGWTNPHTHPDSPARKLA